MGITTFELLYVMHFFVRNGGDKFTYYSKDQRERKIEKKKKNGIVGGERGSERERKGGGRREFSPNRRS